MEADIKLVIEMLEELQKEMAEARREIGECRKDVTAIREALALEDKS